ncbi:MAG: hypothetical protein ACKOOE_05340 [Micrococcales bacterium]
MILKGCWYAVVAAFFWVVASALFGPLAGWLILFGALTLIGFGLYRAFSVPKKDAEALALQQVRIARKIEGALPLELAEDAKTAPRLAAEGSIDGFSINTDGFTEIPASDTPLELTLVCQSAENAGVKTILVAHGQLLIGRVESAHLDELFEAVMAAGGMARCVGLVSRESNGLDVAKPFGLIKGE